MNMLKEDWVRIQKPICDTLWFEGCTHGVYDPEADGLAGCYLEWKCDTHIVYFDVEDAESLEEVDYICVEIVELGTDECHGDAGAEGLVAGVEDMKQICALVEKGQIQTARDLLMAWDVLEGKLATKEMAELHEPRNWNKVEGRPKSQEEIQQDYNAYVAEWAEVDRVCNPIINANLSHLETDLETRLEFN
jgi:hypothetical protein